MNRAFVLGIAVFFAIVGIALLGGDNQAVAGHGCHGCYGGAVCDGGYVCGGYTCGGYACGGCVGIGCQGAVACGGCYGRVHHHRPFFHRRRCGGCVGVACGGCYAAPVACCGAVGTPVIQKGGEVQKAEPVQKDGPVQKAGAVQKVSYRQVPATYYQVTFRR